MTKLTKRQTNDLKDALNLLDEMADLADRTYMESLRHARAYNKLYEFIDSNKLYEFIDSLSK